MVVLRVQQRAHDAERACQVHEKNRDQEDTQVAREPRVCLFRVGVLRIGDYLH